MTRSRDLADSADKDIVGTLTVDAADVQGNITVSGTVDGIDIAARDAVLTSTTTTAGAALPKAGGAMTGAITTNSTFDGRDVATDGTKLDGIEASATADQTNAEIRAAVEAATDSNVFTDADHSKLNAVEASATADQTNAEIRAAVEAASDSNVFTDADHSKLNAVEASADVTDTANVTAAGALMDSEVANLADVKALNQSLVTTASPTFGGLNFDAASGADAQVVMATDSNSRGFYVDESDTNKMKFYTGYGKGVAGREVTLDNFGSLLVGKTASNSDANGVELLPNGTVYITANNTLPFYINRRGGGTELARFSDDGATRGTIASSFAEELMISASGTNSSGILFSQSNQVRPMKNGSTSSGTIDLGAGNGQWKDLYLSGGVNFGNASGNTRTQDATLLDDYEEGRVTLTPATSGGGFSFTAVNMGARYVKIGKSVTVLFDLNFVITNGGSGYFTIYGLPFTPAIGFTNGGYSEVGFRGCTAFNVSAGVPITGWLHNDNRIYPEQNQQGNTTTITPVSVSGATRRITGAVTYFTDA